MQTLHNLHACEFLTQEAPFLMNRTLLGQAVTHFSQPPQSYILISMWHLSFSSNVLLSFFPRLKNEPKPILIVFLTLSYYSFLFLNNF